MNPFSEDGIVYRLLKLAFKARDLHRRPISFTLYGLIVAACFALAFLLRFELRWPQEFTAAFWVALPVLLTIRLALARLFNLATQRWRYVGTEDFLRLVLSNSTGSVLFYLLTWELSFPTTIPRSVIALEWVFSSYGIGGMWMVYRTLFERIRRSARMRGEGERRVLIVGAGEAAGLLAGEMRTVPLGYRPVGFLDDDPNKQGIWIHGVQVLGTISEAGAVADLVAAEELVIAIPSASPERLTEIVEACESTDLPFRLLPPVPEVIVGKSHVHHLRPVQIEDLLGREPVDLELPELAHELREECVLVSGAAGSIGSELSRQIALHQPRRLLLLDQAETPLVELEQRLREAFPDLEMVPLMRDVTQEGRIKALFERYRPNRVFHAAAYKHVPMMEANPVEAIRNNVFGTWVLAKIAGESFSSHFVLISTDKAVAPTSAMGASKRLAELTVMEAQELFPETAFSAVRFGNVLGSAGSVIPLFRKQLEEGKPLTLTHPQMTRYFMTIPEAVQLVLQASLLPNLRGNVAMLEMGNPVRIVDLAKRILRLSGSPSRVGKEITFTGIRPGEKLREELTWTDEDLMATGVPKVHLVLTRQPSTAGLLKKVREWASDQVPEEDNLMEAFEPWLRRPPPDTLRRPSMPTGPSFYTPGH
jgi:FlaA1/EpsC-like NDP-sugar epimerase